MGQYESAPSPLNIFLLSISFVFNATSHRSWLYRAPGNLEREWEAYLISYSVTKIVLTNTQSSGSYPYFNFSNIRYGEAPVGNLRFAAPVAPQKKNAAVNNGQQGVICPQALPGLSDSYRPLYTTKS